MSVGFAIRLKGVLFVIFSLKLFKNLILFKLFNKSVSVHPGDIELTLIQFFPYKEAWERTRFTTAALVEA
jgi:hypothetical protein